MENAITLENRASSRQHPNSWSGEHATDLCGLDDTGRRQGSYGYFSLIVVYPCTLVHLMSAKDRSVSGAAIS